MLQKPCIPAVGHLESASDLSTEYSYEIHVQPPIIECTVSSHNSGTHLCAIGKIGTVSRKVPELQIVTE